MRKVYIFVFSDAVGTREKVSATLDSMKLVSTWRYDIQNCYYIISRATAKELHAEFVSLHGSGGRFMFMEVNANREGLMLSDTWSFLRGEPVKKDAS